MRLKAISYLNPNIKTATGRIILVGMLEDGPVQKPFTTTRARIDLFGKNEMVASYKMLVAAGVSEKNIVLYRLNGNHASLEIAKEGTPFLKIQSIGASNADNDIFVKTYDNRIVIGSHYREEALDKKMDFERTYRFSDFPYLANLTDAINEEAVLGLNDIIAKESVNGLCVDYFVAGKTYQLLNGNAEKELCFNETTDTASYEVAYWNAFYRGVLGEDYSGESATPLMGVPAEVLLFTDIRADISKDIVSFAARVSEQKTREQGTLCNALFQTSIVPSKKVLRPGEYMLSATTYFDIVEQMERNFSPEEDRETYVANLAALFPQEEKGESQFEYVQIVVGDNRYDSSKTLSGFVNYAALYVLSSFEETLGNRTLPSFISMPETLSKSSVATLQANGYICIVPSVRKNYVVAYSQNLADKAETPLHTFSNQRLLHEIGKTVGNRLDGYVGKPTTVFATSILVKELEIYFQNFVSKGILSGFELSFPESEQGIDSRYLDITLRVYDEIKQVGASFRIEENEWEADVWSLID